MLPAHIFFAVRLEAKDAIWTAYMYGLAAPVLELEGTRH
jgi:hypothetical protein